MIYFKYNTSFKKVKDLDKLLVKQKITRIYNEEEFKNLQRKMEHIYCFIDPYCNVIDNELVLHWGETEEQAMEFYHESQEEI